MGKIIDLTGQKFGRLTVLKYAGKNKRNQALWLCQCECGKEKIVLSSCLRYGKTRSCGCLALEIKTKHGLIKHRIRSIYKGMKERCNNPNSSKYKYYGGRGITICDEWQKDLKSFYNWAINNGYTDDLTLDRIDTNCNYCPENCRWSTKAEQLRNTRANRMITYNGETMCLMDWAKKLNIDYMVLLHRLRYNWSIEEAFTITPHSLDSYNAHRKCNYLNYNNKTQTLKKWSIETGIPISTLYGRLKRGWSVEKTLTTPIIIKHSTYKNCKGGD